MSKKQASFVQVETGFLREIGCGDVDRVICMFARAIQQLGFWTEKIQANVDYCYVWRRAECTSLGPGLNHPSKPVRLLTLVWPRRDVPSAEALDVVPGIFFNQASEPTTMTHSLLCCCVFTLLRYHP